MQGRSLLGFVGVRRERAQVHAAYKTVVVSSAMKHYLVTKTGIAPNRVHIEANAVDPTKIHTREENLDTIRRRFQIDSSHMVFGFVGSIFPYHGVDLMITAFAALEKEFPSARMLIVGDGEVLPLLQQRAKNLSLESKVHFTGNIRHQEVFDYLAVMNITVMARSNWYGSPVKIFEYGAMRKAIIAPNVVPVQDVMEHQVHGLLIEDNVQALQEAMRFMIEQDATRAQMAERFHHKVMTEHTWKIVAQHILAAVQ
jgi:glycosyltransferase involved in cell wall biosynthesis